MALAMVLGFTQCKKEQPLEPTNDGNGVRITLNVENGGDNGSRAEINPPHVSFRNGDRILVAYEGKYVGYLQHNGSYFDGYIDADVNPVDIQPLYFYFLGNKVNVDQLTPGSTEECTVNIGDQSDYPTMPVISFSASTEDYSGEGSYTASLHNKASLMKFSVDTPSDAAICITGMNNTVTVTFNDRSENDGFSYGMDSEDGGLIKMAPKDSENVTWAIVLPQDPLEKGAYGTAFSEGNSYSGNRPALGLIELNKFYNESVAMTVNNTVIWDNSVISDIDIHSYDGQPVTIDGISVRGEGEPIAEFNWSSITLVGGRLIFSAPSGYGFTRIEIASNDEIYGDPEGWNKESVGEWWVLVWSDDTPASTVTLPAYVQIYVSGITFTLGEVAPTPPTPTPPTEGVGSLIYDNDNNPIAMVAYVGDDYTLAIRLYDWVTMYDPESEPITNFSWDAANSMIQSYNVFTGEAWRLPTEEEWTKIFVACACSFDGSEWNCDELMTKLNVAGGEPLYKDLDNDYIHFYYWTGTEGDYSSSAKAVDFHKSDGHKIASFVNQDTWNEYLVRPVIQIGGTAPVTPDVTWNTAYNFNCNSPYVYDGITATLTDGTGGGKATWNSQRGLELKSGSTYDASANIDIIHPSSLTFSYNGNITKIEITYDNIYQLTPSGWSDNGSKLTWEGTPASSVTIMSPDYYTDQEIWISIRKVEFYVE